MSRPRSSGITLSFLILTPEIMIFFYHPHHIPLSQGEREKRRPLNHLWQIILKFLLILALSAVNKITPPPLPLS